MNRPLNKEQVKGLFEQEAVLMGTGIKFHTSGWRRCLGKTPSNTPADWTPTIRGVTPTDMASGTAQWLP